ncbi:MAG: phytanoyl-CoA dioxygenase family protein [Pyrinomonadaceae bacterium]
MPHSAPTLTAGQRDKFAADGFLVLPDFVSPASCAALRVRAEKLVESFDPREAVSIFSTREQTRTSDAYFLESGDKIRFFFEEDAFSPDGTLKQSKEGSINKIGHALHDLDPVFDRFSRTPEIAQLIKDLGIERPLLLQSMYIFKQPNIGGEVTCHQDATFLYSEPPHVIGLWFAVEDATLENGCLWVIPGGHKLGLKSRFVRPPDGGARFEMQDETPWPVDAAAPLEVSGGSLIVLHALLPHMSRANRSAKSRHAYTLHVMDGSCHYPADNWLQRPASMPLKGFD